MLFDKKETSQSSPDWYHDRYLVVAIEAKRYFILSILLGSLLMASFISWIITLPLKKTILEPYVIFIDNVTGVTSTLTRASMADYAQDAPVIKYFLARYVRVREGYNDSDLHIQKSIIKAFTSADTYKYFESELAIDREENRKNDRTNIDVLSVTFPFKNIAHVRYAKQTENGLKSTWLATLEIDQMSEINESLAEINPLGLVVLNYETIKEGDYGTFN